MDVISEGFAETGEEERSDSSCAFNLETGVPASFASLSENTDDEVLDVSWIELTD
jgi:hypothetical protein